jgi:dihydroneopterin aldolase / 2-amino-4-hydroxy-6-hydroxymethyldihydropteridine diphosphokinase
MADIIKITGIRSWGHHGALPEETRLGQRFRVNLTLELDTRPAALADDLTKTVNYAEIAHLVEVELKGRPVYLIETLAENMAARLLNAFPVLNAVTIEIEKPSAPVGTDIDGIAVVIRRTRA